VRDLLSTHILKSQLARPQNDNRADEIWCFSVLAPRISKGKSLVLASPEIPTSRPRNDNSADKIWCFGVLAPRISKGESLVLASLEILTCETPK
jgi:hypothetical protein